MTVNSKRLSKAFAVLGTLPFLFVSNFFQNAFAADDAVPPTERTALSNGAPLEVAPKSTMPRTTLVVSFMGGAGRIAKEKQGISSILFDVFRQGPEGMTQEDYKDALFFANGSISFRTDFRATYLVITAPPENLDTVMKLARDVLEKPKLTKENFETSKQKALTERAASDDSMSFVARYFSTRDLFQYHPETLNDTGSVRSLKSLTLADAQKVANTLFPWQSAFYTATGPSRAPALKAALESSLWPTAPSQKPRIWKPATYTAVPALKGKGKTPSAVVIHKPNATDNQVYFYFPLALKLDSPEAHDASVAHEILGGGLTGDLGRVLRVERGLTYHASSFVGARLPVWGVYTFGGLFQTEDLLKGTLEVLEKFRARPLKPEEIALAKDSARTDFQSAFELPSDLLFERVRYRLYGLDERFLDNALQDLEKVTEERVKAFISNKVRTEGGRLYIMGDKSKIVPILKKLGIRDIRTVAIGDIR
jgi:zinc protease